jgi:hypothetical protein
VHDVVLLMHTMALNKAPTREKKREKEDNKKGGGDC